MQRENKVCRQADALIVGGFSISNCYDNLTEVFHRLRSSNMTIKPSKLEICPAKTTLFGWEYVDQAWKPGAHKVNPLIVADPPGTVKQMRSWLGAAKQLSSGLEKYAVTFQPLEQAASNRQSKEKIVWTESLIRQFRKAQELLKTIQDIFYPLPTDQIITYSDFSQDSGSVGGRMEILRTLPDGTVTKYHGGFFSVCLNPTQQRWMPCESECLGVKLVLEHFQPLFRDSHHPIIHYCDNLPTVLAYERAKQGKFSNSSRISCFKCQVSRISGRPSMTPLSTISRFGSLEDRWFLTHCLDV